jgi:AraC-like DNA-binding protein
MTARVSIRYVHKIAAAAAECGVDSLTLLADAALEPLETYSRDARIELAKYARLWQLASDRSGDRGFVFRVARQSHADDDALALACMASGTLGEALEVLARFVGLWTDGSLWQQTPFSGGASMAHLRLDPSRPESAFSELFSLACLTATGRRLTATDWVPLEVCFRAAAPADLGHHQRFFRAPLRFGAERSEVRLSAQVLRLPMVKAEPAFASFFKRHAEEQLRLTASRSGLAGSIRTLLKGQQGGRPSLQRTARELAMSERTLRRRLEAEHVGFKDLVEETQKERAVELLSRGQLSISEIAFLIGYSDVSTFHRAFRRWTGKTPQAMRRAR